MLRVLIFLIVMFACDIDAMKKDRLSPTSATESKPSLRSSASDLIFPTNQSKNVSSHRLFKRAASADTEDTNSKKNNLDSYKNFSQSDDTTTSSSTSSHLFSNLPSSQIVHQVSSRSSSKSPRELKASMIDSSKNVKKIIDSDDKSKKIGYKLCTAIKKNKCVSIKDILNAEDEEARTPLIIAIEEGCNDIVLELLDCSCVDVNKSDKLGRTALIIAIQKLIHFKPSSIKAFQELGDMDKIGSTINDTTIALIKKFLERKDTDPNKADNRKNTPLHYAVLKHSNEVIELLLRDYRINSLLKNVDSRLASQLLDKKLCKNVSSIIRIFFGRATLDALVNDEAFNLHLNEKIIDDEKINQAIGVIKQGVEKDHGQDGDRKLPEKDLLFLEEDFIKKLLLYRLEKSGQPDRIEIIINNSDTTTQEI